MGQSCCFALIKTQMLMRTQPAFQLLPIERIVLPVRSRDELPPILAGKKATGRPGMDLWRILVPGAGNGGQPEFRQRLYPPCGPGTVEPVHSGSGDAQERQKERRGNGTGEAAIDRLPDASQAERIAQREI